MRVYTTSCVHPAADGHLACLRLLDTSSMNTGAQTSESLLSILWRLHAQRWNSLLLWGFSNGSAGKEFAEYSLEGLMLKLQYFGRLMQRAESLEGS